MSNYGAYLQTQLVYAPGYAVRAPTARNAVEWQTLANQKPNPALFEVEPSRCARCTPQLKERFVVPEPPNWKASLPALYYQSLPTQTCLTHKPNYGLY